MSRTNSFSSVFQDGSDSSIDTRGQEEGEEQDEVYFDGSMFYAPYQENGETENTQFDSVWQQCENGEYVQIDASSVPNAVFPLQLVDPNESLQFVDGDQFLIVPKSGEGEGQYPMITIKSEQGDGGEELQEMNEIVTINDEELQQLLASNQYQLVIPDCGDTSGSLVVDPNSVSSSGFLTFNAGNVCYNIPNEAQQMSVSANTEGVVYVNPKQYNRIMKRREARAKLKSRIAPRAKYLHESRHKRAMTRVRVEGGKFASKPVKEPPRKIPKGFKVAKNFKF